MEILEENDHLRDIFSDGTLILKQTSKEWFVNIWVVLTRVALGPLVCFCDHGYEPSGFVTKIILWSAA